MSGKSQQLLNDLVSLDPKEAVANPQPEQQSSSNDIGWAQYAARFIASSANAAVGDFGDEALSALGQDEIAAKLKESEQYLKDNGVWGDYTLSKIAGSLVPGGLIGKALGVGRGVTKAANARRAISAGAVEGAVFGAGEAEGTASERVDDALLGAALGGTGTFVLGKAIDSLSGLARGSVNAADRVRNIGTDVSQADKKLFDRAINEISQESSIPVNVLVDGVGSGKSIQRVLQENGLSESEAVNIINIPLNKNPEAAFQVGRDARASAVNERNQLTDIAEDGLRDVNDDAVKIAGRETERIYESNVLQGRTDLNTVVSTPFNDALDELVNSPNARLVTPELDIQIAKALRDPKYSDEIAEAGYSSTETPQFKRFASKEDALEKSGSPNLVQLIVKDSSKESEEYLPFKLDARVLRRVFAEIDEESGKAFGKGFGDEGRLLSNAQQSVRDLAESYFARQGLRQANIDYSKIENANEIIKQTRSLVRKSEVTPSEIDKFKSVLDSNKNMDEVDKFQVMQTALADVAANSKKPIEVPFDIKEILRNEAVKKDAVDNGIRLQQLEKLVDKLNVKLTLGKPKITSPQSRDFKDVVQGEISKAAPLATVFGITAGVKIALARLTFEGFRRKFSGDISYSDPQKVRNLFEGLTNLDDTTFNEILTASLRTKNNKSAIQNFFDTAEQNFLNTRAKAVGSVAAFDNQDNDQEQSTDESIQQSPNNQNSELESILNESLGNAFPIVSNEDADVVDQQSDQQALTQALQESLGNSFTFN